MTNGNILLSPRSNFLSNSLSLSTNVDETKNKTLKSTIVNHETFDRRRLVIWLPMSLQLIKDFDIVNNKAMIFLAFVICFYVGVFCVESFRCVFLFSDFSLTR